MVWFEISDDRGLLERAGGLSQLGGLGFQGVRGPDRAVADGCQRVSEIGKVGDLRGDMGKPLEQLVELAMQASLRLAHALQCFVLLVDCGFQILDAGFQRVNFCERPDHLGLRMLMILVIIGHDGRNSSDRRQVKR